MKKGKKRAIIVILIIILLAGLGLAGYYFYSKKEEEQSPVKTIEVVDSIIGYDYKLEDRDTKLFKETFLKLKEILENEEELDEKLYAEYLAELFVIDLYTIDNKISKYDVGSLDYIYPEEQEKFQKKVMDTLYKLVEDNSTNTRQQQLPVVSQVEMKEIKETKYKKGSTEQKGYKVSLSVEYEKDLKYDTDVEVTVVKEEKRFYVVNLTAKEK